MADSTSVENLNGTLKSLRSLRNSFTHFLSSLTEYSKSNMDDEIENTGQKLFHVFRSNLRELEKNINQLSPTASTPSLSNIEVLSLDPSSDKLTLYHQLLDCYTWIDKVYSYSGMVHSICSGNHLKRSSMPTKRKRLMPTVYNANVTPHTVDTHIQNIKSMFPDMTLVVVRPMGTNAVLQVTLGRVLKAVVTFRGLLIEAVVVRGHNESHTDEDGKVDLYRPSSYKVFQKVSDSANAAMLHFFTPGFVDLSIRSFFTWLNSFSSLFTDVCRKCQNHLRYNQPPTWREFRTLHPYHEECRP